MVCLVFFFKQKTAYEMRISDWSSDVCSSDLNSSRASIVATWMRIIQVIGAMGTSATSARHTGGASARGCLSNQTQISTVTAYAKAAMMLVRVPAPEQVSMCNPVCKGTLTRRVNAPHCDVKYA